MSRATLSSRSARTSLASLLFALLIPTGCLRVAPKMPRAIASAAPIQYTSRQFDSDVTAYRNAMGSSSGGSARLLRDQIIYRVMAQTDAAYGSFEVHLNVQRAGARTAGDAAQLGLTAAATVVGASGVKDILSASATALQGTQLSFDKNYFEQKTTEALVSQMRANRATLKAQVLLNLSSRDVTSYPLEAAWVDLIDYYYAGTLPSALVALSSNAGSSAVKADDHLQSVVKQLTPATPAQAREARSIRGEYESLKRRLASPDQAVVQVATDELHRVLTRARVPFDAASSPSALLTVLLTAMGAAADDHELLDNLQEAVTSLSQPTSGGPTL